MSPKLAPKILFGIAILMVLAFIFLYYSNQGSPEFKENYNQAPSKSREDKQPEANKEKEDDSTVDLSQKMEDKAKEMIKADLKEKGEVDQNTREQIQDMVKEQINQEKLDGTTTQEEQEQEQRQPANLPDDNTYKPINQGETMQVNNGILWLGGDNYTANPWNWSFLVEKGRGDIGTTSPAYALDVVGYDQFSQPVTVGTPTADTHVITKSYVDSELSEATSIYGHWLDSGSGDVYKTNTGNVGIGTTAPDTALHVIGTTIISNNLSLGGTIISGLWQGDKIGTQYGGTNWNSSTATGTAFVSGGCLSSLLLEGA